MELTDDKSELRYGTKFKLSSLCCIILSKRIILIAPYCKGLLRVLSELNLCEALTVVSGTWEAIAVILLVKMLMECKLTIEAKIVGMEKKKTGCCSNKLHFEHQNTVYTVANIISMTLTKLVFLSVVAVYPWHQKNRKQALIEF